MMLAHILKFRIKCNSRIPCSVGNHFRVLALCKAVLTATSLLHTALQDIFLLVSMGLPGVRLQGLGLRQLLLKDAEWI